MNPPDICLRLNPETTLEEARAALISAAMGIFGHGDLEVPESEESVLMVRSKDKTASIELSRDGDNALLVLTGGMSTEQTELTGQAFAPLLDPAFLAPDDMQVETERLMLFPPETR